MSTQKQRSVIEPYYRRIRGNHCAYCGARASQVEHVMPASVMFDMIKLEIAEPSLIVPSCAECNSLASDSVQYTFVGRREFIRDKLRNKYARILNLKYELSELIHESNETVLEKFDELRLQARLQDRLLHNHSYEFAQDHTQDQKTAVSSLTYDCPRCKCRIFYKCHKSYELAHERKQPCSKCVGQETYRTTHANRVCTCICKCCGCQPNHKYFGSCDDWHKRKYGCVDCSRKAQAKKQ